MTTSFISESIDQELSLEEMEELNGGTFGGGILVRALAATVHVDYGDSLEKRYARQYKKTIWKEK